MTVIGVRLPFAASAGATAAPKREMIRQDFIVAD